MAALLKVEDVHAGYDAKPVLHGVSLHVDPKEVVALIGPNGAGKSTLLKAVFGIVHCSQGTITYRGGYTQNRNPALNAHCGLAYIPQGSRVFPEMTVTENLEVGGNTLERREQTARIGELLSLFPLLQPLLRRRAGTLSTGEQQMVALARALMVRPQLLLVDEPSLGLGPKPAQSILQQLKQLRNDMGASVLLVEQNVREALAIADRVYALRLGVIAFEARPGDISTEDLHTAFLQ